MTDGNIHRYHTFLTVVLYSDCPSKLKYSTMRVIHIAVDLTEASRNLVHAIVELPVHSNSVAIVATPLWIQESHRDNGPVAGITGLFFSSGGKTLPWRRNPSIVSQYHVDIPLNVDTVHIEFDAVITRKVTRRIVMLGWESVLFHPVNRAIGKTPIQASVTVPREWGVGTALQNLGKPIVTNTADGKGKTLLYQPTNVERLADSPVLAGLHFHEFAITTDQRHILCVAADTAEFAMVPQDALDKLSRLVNQVFAVFGPRHYETFRILVALTDHWPNPGGSEHHDSCDISLPCKALSDRENLDRNGSVITHEFIHSWNGKYRRPAGHMPQDFTTPLDGRLLWIYEGLTQYYEGVLSVRGGVMSSTTYMVELARAAAFLQGQTGRFWRSIEDTGTGSSLRGSLSWANWARTSEDYYYEGVFVWLDVDTVIRSKTGGHRSLDDFARLFFGKGRATGPEVVAYKLKEIVSILGHIVSHDWQGLFESKVLNVSPEFNIEGIERAGYRLIYTNHPETGQENERAMKDAIWNSIGVKFGEAGQVEDVRRYGPADIAKLAPRQTIIKVGESMFSLEVLVAELNSEGPDRKTPILLTILQEDEEWEVKLDYHGGLRYPLLERLVGEEDMLAAILAEKDFGL